MTAPRTGWSTPAAAASRPSPARWPTTPTGPPWDRALADRLRAFEPDLVVSAGFMKLVGPAVLGAFGGRLINTHPALLPAFPGAHAVRDALAAGVSVTGATVHVVDAGLDTGPVLAQRRGRPSCPGTTRRGCTNGSRTWSASSWCRRWRTRHRNDEGEPPMTDRTPIRRALLGVYDKAGIEELAAGLAAAGRGAGEHRRDRRAGSPTPASRSPRSSRSPASPSASTAG